MTRYAFYAHYQDCYEYHGSTTIERIRREAGKTVNREWILFDSVEEALEFFNNTRILQMKTSDSCKILE